MKNSDLTLKNQAAGIFKLRNEKRRAGSVSVLKMQLFDWLNKNAPVSVSTHQTRDEMTKSPS